MAETKEGANNELAAIAEGGDGKESLTMKGLSLYEPSESLHTFV